MNSLTAGCTTCFYILPSGQTEAVEDSSRALLTLWVLKEAEIRELSMEEIQKITTENSKKLYRF